MKTYGQYCPISRSAELLGDRWTIHIVRDLLTGTTRFNELISGNPGLSRALLSRRLQQLKRAGVITQEPNGSYRLTSSGRDLEPVVFGLATWGALDVRATRAGGTRPGPAHVVAAPPPRPDGVARNSLHDLRQLRGYPKRYWIVVDPDASLCLADPRFDIDVAVRTDRSTLYRVYLGHVPLAEAHRTGRIELTGPKSSVRSFLHAFQQSPVALIVAAEAPE